MSDGTGDTAAITRAVTRGTVRLMEEMGHAVITEFSLADGHHADIATLDRQGTITLIEVKSGLADFRADGKWPAYRDYCDQFYFAVAPSFPLEILPGADICGLILADTWEAEVIRPSPLDKLTAARRKAVTLRFARHAAFRLREFREAAAEAR